jgi:hypothetical protein
MLPEFTLNRTPDPSHSLRMTEVEGFRMTTPSSVILSRAKNLSLVQRAKRTEEKIVYLLKNVPFFFDHGRILL